MIIPDKQIIQFGQLKPDQQVPAEEQRTQLPGCVIWEKDIPSTKDRQKAS